jgi:hypothetical protein
MKMKIPTLAATAAAVVLSSNIATANAPSKEAIDKIAVKICTAANAVKGTPFALKNEGKKTLEIGCLTGTQEGMVPPNENDFFAGGITCNAITNGIENRDTDNHVDTSICVNPQINQNNSAFTASFEASTPKEAIERYNKSIMTALRLTSKNNFML